MNKKVIIILSLCVVVGTATGVIVGKCLASDEEKTTEAEVKSPSIKRFSARGGAPEMGDENPEKQMDGSEFDYKIYETLSYDQVRERLLELNEDMSLREKDGYNIYLLCQRWGAISPKAALTEIKEMGYLRRVGSPESAIMNGWASKDPESAAAYYMEERENNPKMRKNGISSTIIYRLVEESPEKAWEFYSGLTKKEKGNAGSSMFWGMLSDRSRDLSKYSDMLTDVLKEIPSYNRDHYASQWKERDEESFNKWKESLAEEDQRSVTLRELTADVIKNPDAVADALSRLTDEDRKDFLAQSFWDAFRKEGSVKMMDWLLRQAPKGTEKDVMRTHMGMVKSKEYAEMETWIKNLPAGESRDAAISVFSDKTPIPGHDMNGVMGLAQSLTDEKSRKQSMERILENWARSDAKSATQWLNNSSGFSSEEQEKWSQKIEKINKSIIK